MATKRAIFELYCHAAINRLETEGIIRGDYDWDMFNCEVPDKDTIFTMRSVDETTGRPKAYFIIEYKGDTISVFDEISKKQKECDFINVENENTGDSRKFGDFMMEFVKELKL